MPPTSEYHLYLMSRQVRCPNCGGGHTLVNPGIQMVVCDYCQTTFYWDKDGTAKMGTKSILPDSDSRLYMGATGKILGKTFQVVGHVRYEHSSGAWDEWYMNIEGGKAAWVSEDERKLSLERALKIEQAPPPAQDLQLGYKIKLSGHVFTVRETGVAKCVGNEGQLPFTVLPEEQYPYADVATPDGKHFGTIEYDEDGEVHAFMGKPLTHEQVTLDAPKPDKQQDLSEHAKDIECPNCGAPLEQPKGRTSDTIVCPFCGSQNDLTGSEARVMGINPKGLKTGLLFKVGASATFNGIKYEVCGRMVYKDDEGYRSREYLMWNQDRGYLWLAEENGHWVLSKPTRQTLKPDPLVAGYMIKPKSKFGMGNTDFAFYEKTNEQLVYVDGALPWLASVGDRFTCTTLVAPPRQYEIETDGSEVEYFLGKYMTPQEVFDAFGEKRTPPQPNGVFPCQPFTRGPTANALLKVGLVFAAINLLLLAYSYFISEPDLIFSGAFDDDAYLKETISEPFSITEGGVMDLKLHAPVSNNWLALDFALVDSNDKVQAEAGSEVSYYYGYEGGESWTEGSQTTEAFFKAPPPGTYRLILKGEAGTTRPPRIQVKLYQGAILSRYFLIIFIFTALAPLFEITRQKIFESRRWAPVTEDDDD